MSYQNTTNSANYTFQTNCGHHGTVKSVKKLDGPKAGMWLCRMRGPSVTGKSGIRSVYSQPNMTDAKAKIAQALRTSSYDVHIATTDTEVDVMAFPSLSYANAHSSAASRDATRSKQGMLQLQNDAYGYNSSPREARQITAFPRSDAAVTRSQSNQRKLEYNHAHDVSPSKLTLPMSQTQHALPSSSTSTDQKYALPINSSNHQPSIAADRHARTNTAAASYGNSKDKSELSPNSLAKCRTCKETIRKNTLRVGLWTFDSRHKKALYYYYHGKCCPADKLASLRSSSRQIDESLERHLASLTVRCFVSQQDEERLVRQRLILRNDLIALREEFAYQLRWPARRIYDDQTLDQLVAHMPRTQPELLEVYGIGPKRALHFGPSILLIIQQYREKYEYGGSDRKATSGRSLSNHAATTSISLPRTTVAPSSLIRTPLCSALGSGANHPSISRNGLDCSLVVGTSANKSLSFQEIVSRKIQGAQRTGTIIEID